MSVNLRSAKGPRRASVRLKVKETLKCFFCYKNFNGKAGEESPTQVPIKWLTKYLGVDNHRLEKKVSTKMTQDELHLLFCSSCADLAGMLEVQCEELEEMQSLVNTKIRELHVLFAQEREMEQSWQWRTLWWTMREKCVAKVEYLDAPEEKEVKGKLKDGNFVDVSHNSVKMEIAQNVKTEPGCEVNENSTAKLTVMEASSQTVTPEMKDMDSQTLSPSSRSVEVQTLRPMTKVADVQTSPPTLKDVEIQTVSPVLQETEVQTVPILLEDLPVPVTPIVIDTDRVAGQPSFNEPEDSEHSPSRDPLEMEEEVPSNVAVTTNIVPTSPVNPAGCGFIDTFYEGSDPEDADPVAETPSVVKPSVHVACPYCDDISPSQEDLNFHLIFEHPENLITCTKSPKITDRQYHLICKKVIDWGCGRNKTDKGSQCRHCADKFINDNFVKAHLLDCHMPQLVQKVSQLQAKLTDMQIERNPLEQDNDPDVIPIISSVVSRFAPAMNIFTNVLPGHLITPNPSGPATISKSSKVTKRVIGTVASGVSPSSSTTVKKKAKRSIPVISSVTSVADPVRPTTVNTTGPAEAVPVITGVASVVPTSPPAHPAPILILDKDKIVSANCPVCNEILCGIDSLSTHMVVKHGMTPYIPSVQNAPTSSNGPGSATASRRTSAAAGPSKPTQPKPISIRIDPRKSAPIALDDVVWECNKCSKYFLSTDALETHQKTMCERILQCPICAKSGFKNADRLNFHLQYAHRQRAPAGVSPSLSSIRPVATQPPLLSYSHNSLKDTQSSVPTGNCVTESMEGSVLIPANSTSGLLTLHYGNEDNS